MQLTTTAPKTRIDSIDGVRGLVMVVMALDHARDFLTHLNYRPTDLTQASTALFLTRFVTHYCAPAFVFLAGTSAFLSISRGKPKGQAARFLLTRGLWLLLLEMTVIRFGWLLHVDYHFLHLQVIWVIAVSLLMLAGLIYLPRWAIALFGLVLVLGHNAFDNVSTADFPPTGKLIWSFLHVSGMVDMGTVHIRVLYPLVPWVGVTALGYCLGAVYELDAARRKRLLIRLGISALLLFVFIRALNGYGDPVGWTSQPVWYRTILSFINVGKYPPSLDFLLVTLGPVMLLLAAVENRQDRISRLLLVYGRVPLFFYILHLYLLRVLSLLMYTVFQRAEGYSFPLPVVYGIWLTAVVFLYLPCRWFMNYKQTHRHWWLSYL